MTDTSATERQRLNRERQRRHRARKQSDIKVIQIELGCLEREVLVDRGVIDFSESDDPAALSEAVKNLIAGGGM